MKTPRFVRLLSATAIVLATASAAGAQTQSQAQTATRTPVGVAGSVTISAVIQAIDSSARTVTLKGQGGNVVTIVCGPEIQRFNELKVGDTVTFQYHEGVVFSIAAPGSTPPPPGTAVVRSGGDRPAAMVAKRETAVVTILAIDPKVPSVTIEKADGGKMSFKVEDPKNLEHVKVGDKVQIVYAQALAISVK